MNEKEINKKRKKRKEKEITKTPKLANIVNEGNERKKESRKRTFLPAENTFSGGKTTPIVSSLQIWIETIIILSCLEVKPFETKYQKKRRTTTHRQIGQNE